MIFRSLKLISVFASVITLVLMAPLHAQLDETCLVTVNGQTVTVGIGGEYSINNIPAGANLVRLHAVCTDSTQTRYGRSGFFQVINNQDFFISELDLVWRTMPFASTSKLLAAPAAPTLTQIGQTTQITVTAFRSDSTQQDVTARAFGSTYTSSNTGIITVDQEGLVTATGDGVGFVTVSNEGATAAARINVSLGDPLTTVQGFVQLEDNTFVVGAEVVVNLGGVDTTDSTGHFSTPGVATTLGLLRVTATADTGGAMLFGISDLFTPVPGGFTGAGIITITDHVYWITNADGFWHDAANWNGGSVPGPADRVIIDVPGEITVTHSQDADTVATLFSTEKIALTGGTLAISDSAIIESSLSLAGGTLTGMSDITVNELFKWTGGTLSGVSQLHANGGIEISGSSTKFFEERTLNNAGAANWVSTVPSTINAGNGAVINNLGAAVFEIQSRVDLDIGFAGPLPVFNNQGVLRVIINSGNVAVLSAILNNTGTIDVQSGGVRFSQGGQSSGQITGSGNGVFECGGDFTFDAGSSITVPNVYFVGDSAAVNGTYDVMGSTEVGGIVDFSGNIVDIGNRVTVRDGEANFIANIGHIGDTLQVTGGMANFSNIEGAIAIKHLELSGGELTGTSDITVSELFRWTGGLLSGVSQLHANGGIEISGPSTKAFEERTLNNAGVATWVTGQINAGNGAVINNLGAAVFEIQSRVDLDIGFAGPLPVFNNQGVLRVIINSGNVAVLSAILNNTGTIDVQSGGVLFSQGGQSSGQITGSGNGVFECSGGFAFDAGSSITVPNVYFVGDSAAVNGTYDVMGSTEVGGIVDFSGNIVDIGNRVTVRDGEANFIANIGHIGDTLQVTGGMANFSNIEGAIATKHLDLSGGGELTGTSDITVSELFRWTGGLLSGVSQLHANGGIEISGPSTKAFEERTLNNAGVATWVTGQINAGNGAVINNLGAAVFEIQIDDDLVFAITGPQTVFNNQGTLRKSSGIGTTSLQVDFNNSDTLEVQTGLLDFTQAYTQTSGTTFLNGGDLSSTDTLDIQGGSLSGIGSVSANVAMDGATNPGGSPGILNITGDYTQNSSGVLNTEIGGLTAGTDFDQLNITGTANLDGTLNISLINGFSPTLGQSFIILTFASSTGNFSTINGTQIGGGLEFQVDLNASDVTLVVVQQ